jgi:hypothetical protein
MCGLVKLGSWTDGVTTTEWEWGWGFKLRCCACCIAILFVVLGVCRFDW